MHFFYKDIYQGICLTWDNLLDDVNNALTYNPYCKTDNFYHVFRNLITSMIIGKEIILKKLLIISFRSRDL